MANESESVAGSHPAGAGAEPDQETRGWGGSEIVHDQGGAAAGGSGWESEGVVRDQGENDAPEGAGGWSGSAVVRDQGEQPDEDGGGWSGSEVVKDHGEGPAS